MEHDPHLNSSQKSNIPVCISSKIHHDLYHIPSQISAIFSIDHWLIMLNPHLMGKKNVYFMDGYPNERFSQ